MIVRSAKPPFHAASVQSLTLVRMNVMSVGSSLIDFILRQFSCNVWLRASSRLLSSTFTVQEFKPVQGEQFKLIGTRKGEKNHNLHERRINIKSTIEYQINHWRSEQHVCRLSKRNRKLASACKLRRAHKICILFGIKYIAQVQFKGELHHKHQ